MGERKKMSKARVLALTVSVALHGAVFYYLGSMALDYALPEGQVTSYEMDFSKGHQLETTEVDVIESKEPTPPTPPPVPIAKAKPKPAPTPESPPKTLPPKEVVDEPIADDQGTMPVATEIPEDLQKDLITEEEEPVADTEPSDELPTEEQEVVASAQPPSGQGVSDQPFGTPTGVQSDTVLIPYGSNRPITYPHMARLRRMEGTCIVHYTVSAEGSVIDIKVVQSAGYSALDAAAVSTIKYWKFKPTGREGVYERPVRFQLTGNPKEAPAKLRRTN